MAERDPRIEAVARALATAEGYQIQAPFFRTAVGRRFVRLGALAVEEIDRDVAIVEILCACGHPKERHVMGRHYCMEGCYTTPAQAEYLRGEMGDRPTCEAFTADASQASEAAHA